MTTGLLSPQSISTKRSLAVYLKGLGTAVPPFSVSQETVLSFIIQNFSIQERTKAVYRKTLTNPSIRKRHFALSSMEETLEKKHDAINKRFEAWSTRLGSEALQKALNAADVRPGDLDFLAATTCTGLLCPGLSTRMIDACGLRKDLHLADLVGMGCGAAIPALEQAHNFCLANPGATAAVVCSEICSAAFFSNDDIGVAISNTLFGDGAAAVVIKSEYRNTAAASATPNFLGRVSGFASLTVPEWREELRFQTENGHLKNVLGVNVPYQAASLLGDLLSRLEQKQEVPKKNIHHWILHAGGQKVLDTIEHQLQLDPVLLSSARRVLEQFGNMSSPTVLFVLQDQLARCPPKSGEMGIVSSFGAGMSAHATLLQF